MPEQREAAAGRGLGLSPEPMEESPAAAWLREKDEELLDLAQRCHPQTLRQQRWTNAMIKVVSPQVLTS